MTSSIFGTINLKKKLDKSGLAAVSKNTIKTLLLGKRDALDQELKNAYAKAGVINVLAISGLHIGIIMLFLGVVLKPIKSIPGGHWIYVPSILTLLLSFAFFTGGSPSVIRVVTMFTGLVIAKYSLRVSNTFHLLVVSFFLLVVIYPPFLYQVGFQMSYLAVLGIIKLHPLFQNLSISTTMLLFIYILIILLYLLINHKKIKYLIAILSMLLFLQLYVIKVAWSASQIN